MWKRQREEIDDEKKQPAKKRAKPEHESEPNDNTINSSLTSGVSSGKTFGMFCFIDLFTHFSGHQLQRQGTQGEFR